MRQTRPRQHKKAPWYKIHHFKKQIIIGAVVILSTSFDWSWIWTSAGVFWSLSVEMHSVTQHNIWRGSPFKSRYHAFIFFKQRGCIRIFFNVTAVVFVLFLFYYTLLYSTLKCHLHFLYCYSVGFFVEITCDSGFYGPDCKKRCRPVFHGYCDNNGVIQCYPGQHAGSLITDSSHLT